MESNILAISGSNELLLVALKTPSGVFFRTHSKGLQHNEHIVGLCQAVLEDAQCSLQSLTAIAVDLGPSSFTGQRISLSFAKGSSFALKKPLLGISAFSLWERYYRGTNCPKDISPLLILIDGRKRRFYASLYTEKENMSWDLGTTQLCQTLYAYLGEASPLSVTGPGAALFLEELAEQKAEPVWKNLYFHTPAQEADLAKWLLVLAEEQLQAQSFMKASDGPIYLRKSDAQEQRERNSG